MLESVLSYLAGQQVSCPKILLNSCLPQVRVTPTCVRTTTLRTYWSIAELSAGHIGIESAPALVANRAPGFIPADLNPATVSVGSIDKPQVSIVTEHYIDDTLNQHGTRLVAVSSIEAYIVF